MKLASYVGTHAGYKGISNILIRLRLSGIKEALHLSAYGSDTLRASHSEIVFEPSDAVDHYMPDKTCKPDQNGALWCVSSTGTDRLPMWSARRAGELGGVRFKRIILNDPKWELQDIPYFDPTVVAQFACEHEGAMYDWQAVIGFLAKFVHEKENRFMCSEFCAAALNILDAHEQDPCKLQQKINELYTEYCNKSDLEKSIAKDLIATKQFFQGSNNA